MDTGVYFTLDMKTSLTSHKGLSYQNLLFLTEEGRIFWTQSSLILIKASLSPRVPSFQSPWDLPSAVDYVSLPLLPYPPRLLEGIFYLSFCSRLLASINRMTSEGFVSPRGRKKERKKKRTLRCVVSWQVLAVSSFLCDLF
jgi:hypothetical protein